ncbi:MAG TPA: hypothetical protein VM165_04260 [Planctomycetaceae bacterium]|nr:hypothetical protein [Planctomycetaceae bacterium]
MNSDQAQQVAHKAKALYQERYRAMLEETNPGAFVCIEPESGDYFLGATLDDAVNQAIDVYPDHLTYTLRVGRAAALHLGVFIQ